jgi:hypothetical protein
MIGAFKSLQTLFASDTSATAGFHSTVLISALASRTVLFAFPIICTLPYTGSSLDDIRSGYIKFIMVRTAKPQYIRNKALAICFSGGLALFVGILASQMVFYLLFSPMEMVTPDTIAPSMLGEIAGKAFSHFMFGALFSIIGALAAVFTMNKYMAYASPFILYYVLVILCERYLKGVYVLNPQEWLNPSETWVGGSLGAILLMGELITVFVLLFYCCVRKRLEHV